MTVYMHLQNREYIKTFSFFPHRWTSPFQWQINNPANDDRKFYWKARMFKTGVAHEFRDGLLYEEFKECFLLNLWIRLKFFMKRRFI